MQLAALRCVEQGTFGHSPQTLGFNLTMRFPFSPVFALSGLPFLLSAVGCAGDSVSAPDISEIRIAYRPQHFERDLARAARSGTQASLDSLRATYPIFFDSVWLNIMLPGGAAAYDSAIVTAWAREPQLVRLLDTVLRAYPPDRGGGWEAELEEGLRYARYYFPDRPTPEVISYVSEFSLGALTYGDSLLGIGLDFHLGAGFPGYANEVFPRYIQRSMDRASIVPRALEAYASNVLGEAPGERMLDLMLHNGKLLFVKRKLMPGLPDTAVLGFGKASLAWLRGNEVQLWEHYLDQDLLYETKPSRIGKLIGPSPNAPGMPPEAPGANANWIGMRIVEAYARRHPETSLEEILANTDAQAFLTESRYKPGL